ncbi:MAG: hypothetical protein HFE78_08515 [Clostridiales bacterium]|nr:hypothetical protein [Clostridiales bacterium]
MPERTIAIRVSEELYRQIKIRIASEDISLKDYVTILIKRDLEQNKNIDWTAIPADNTVSLESVTEAQKVLDFVNHIIQKNNGEK